jgi:putative transposase
MEADDLPEPPTRKSPIHLPIAERGNLSPIIFVTVCAKGRKRILAQADVHDLMLSAWDDSQFWIIGRYILLPDHLHFFCSPRGPECPPLKKWVRFWKAVVSRKWPRRQEQPIWENDFWDRQLRRGDRYSEKWEYVRQNAVRHGLVEEAGDWPYHGELNILEWHDE